MDAVDLSDRIRAQDAALKRARAGPKPRRARPLRRRSRGATDKLSALQAASEEVASPRQEREIAEAGLVAAREELARVQSERAALVAQLDNLKLVAPVDGVVTLREAEPGTTVVAGHGRGADRSFPASG